MQLTLEHLRNEIPKFTKNRIRTTQAGDGKSIGTSVEDLFFEHLINSKYLFKRGNAASGLDLPELETDIKTTLESAPQSSAPFRSIKEIVFGLGYNIVLILRDASGTIIDSLYVPKEFTADFEVTLHLKKLLENEGTDEEILSYLRDSLKSYIDCDCGIRSIVKDIRSGREIRVGLLTLSPALQLRIQYAHAMNPPTLLPF